MSDQPAAIESAEEFGSRLVGRVVLAHGMDGYTLAQNAIKQRDAAIRADERARVIEIVRERLNYVTTGLVYRGRDYVPAPDVVRALDRCQKEIVRALATERDEPADV